MTINFNKGCAPFVFKCSHDKDSKVFYTMAYRPYSWQADKSYVKNIDIVIPSVSNGMAYVVDSGGVSGSTEPAWIAQENEVTTDNEVIFKAVEYDFLLNYNDAITVSNWSGETGVSFDNEKILSGCVTTARLVSVPDIKKTTIVNHITVIRNNGSIEEFDRSIILKIKQT